MNLSISGWLLIILLFYHTVTFNLFFYILDLCLFHCVKRVLIRSYSDLYLSAFGVNTERYRVSLVFSPNAGKYRPE